MGNRALLTFLWRGLIGGLVGGLFGFFILFFFLSWLMFMALPFLIFTPIWGITFLAIIRLINKNEVPADAGVNNLATGRIIIGALLGGLEGGALAYLDYSKITFLSSLIVGFGS